MCIDRKNINPPQPPFCKGGSAEWARSSPLCKRGAGGDLNLRPRFSLLAPHSCQSGISLIELIMFIVIISIAVAGILLVMNKVTGRSADTLVRKQALAIAESFLEEIQLQDLSGVACVGTLAANASRSGVGAVCDYNGYTTTAGILYFSTNDPVAGLESYNITSVSMTRIADMPGGTLGGTAIPAGSGVMITVTVSDPSNQTLDATGYRAGN